MKIIFICIKYFPEHITDNIKNLLLFNNTDITVLTNLEFFDRYKSIYPNIDLVDYETLNDGGYTQASRFNNNRLDHWKLWLYSSLRLFYLYSYLKQYNIQNSVHIENDVMIYENLDNLTFPNNLYYPFDAPTRAICSFLFVPEHTHLLPIIENYDFNKNDMENLSRFSSVAKSLPIIPLSRKNNTEITMYNSNFPQFNCIFDAAAIGQYVGGIDPMNKKGDTRGFVNETCVVKYNNYKFFWKKTFRGTQILYKPVIIFEDRMIPIINLHLHSKRLYNFLANNPIECKHLIVKFD